MDQQRASRFRCLALGLELLDPSAKIDDPTEKCRLTLSGSEHAEGESPVYRVYFLNPEEAISTIEIKPVSQKESLFELLRAAFRLDINDSVMLKRQFSTIYQVTQLVQVKKLIYPAHIPSPAQLASFVFSDIMNNPLAPSNLCSLQKSA